MAYGFAKQSGGYLQISSTDGTGTDVELWLPRADRVHVSAPARAEAAMEPDPSRAAARVLVVDDSKTLRSLTAMQLTQEGFDVRTASSGAEAIALIGEQPEAFDVLLTDYAMPLMSGLELVAAARQYRASFPAVIITGYAEVEAMRNRPDDVIVVPKPFTLAHLLTALESSLGSGQRASSGQVNT
jgi:CheY-like chemotaxis protein